MQISIHDFLVHTLAIAMVVSALFVVFVSSPVYSAFFLAIVMSLLGALFFILEAPFVAVTQIIVYAGAVMVLFVMVLMLFDLKKEVEDTAKLSIGTLTKIISAGVLCGILIGTGWLVSWDGAGSIFVYPNQTTKEANSVYNHDGSAPTQTVVNAEDLKTEVVEITQNQGDATALFKDYTETQKLSVKLFSKYIFIVEVLGVVMLVAIVGAVALARSKGGTHHVVRRS